MGGEGIKLSWGEGNFGCCRGKPVIAHFQLNVSVAAAARHFFHSRTHWATVIGRGSLQAYSIYFATAKMHLHHHARGGHGVGCKKQDC